MSMWDLDAVTLNGYLGKQFLRPTILSACYKLCLIAQVGFLLESNDRSLAIC